MCENDPSNAYRERVWQTYVNGALDDDSRRRKVEIWDEFKRSATSGQAHR